MGVITFSPERHSGPIATTVSLAVIPARQQALQTVSAAIDYLWPYMLRAVTVLHAFYKHLFSEFQPPILLVFIDDDCILMESERVDWRSAKPAIRHSSLVTSPVEEL